MKRKTLSKTLILVSQQLRGENFHKTNKICSEVVHEESIPYSGDFTS